MRPQSGVGSWAPRPRNDRADAVRITPPKSSDTWTISGVIELGRMCRSRIRCAGIPSARQLSTYGRPATEAAWPRISLVYHGHQVTEIAMIRLVRLDRKST